jgi:hypothetical protein
VFAQPTFNRAIATEGSTWVRDAIAGCRQTSGYLMTESARWLAISPDRSLAFGTMEIPGSPMSVFGMIFEILSVAVRSTLGIR